MPETSARAQSQLAMSAGRGMCHEMHRGTVCCTNIHVAAHRRCPVIPDRAAKRLLRGLLSKPYGATPLTTRASPASVSHTRPCVCFATCLKGLARPMHPWCRHCSSWVHHWLDRINTGGKLNTESFKHQPPQHSIDQLSTSSRSTGHSSCCYPLATVTTVPLFTTSLRTSP